MCAMKRTTKTPPKVSTVPAAEVLRMVAGESELSLAEQDTISELLMKARRLRGAAPRRVRKKAAKAPPAKRKKAAAKKPAARKAKKASRKK